MWLLRMTAHALADSGAGETPLMPLALLEEAEAGGEGAASLQVGRTLVFVGWFRGRRGRGRRRVQVGPTLLWPPGCKTRYSLVLVSWEKGDAIILFAAGERR